MNLSEMDDADAKRLVDFAAGLTFGLHGRIERVTAKVFLLSPHNVSVTAARTRRRSRTDSSTRAEPALRRHFLTLGWSLVGRLATGEGDGC